TSSSSPPPSKKPQLPPRYAPKTRAKDTVFARDSSGSGTSSSFPPPCKKARIADSNPSILPISAPETQRKAAEAVILAAAMLRGGTLDQQKEAETFVANEIARHDKGVSDELIVRLKGSAKEDNDGIWVSKAYFW
ncbi:unnamed protein product, partial [Ectocarpus fasciculatus]